MLESNCNCTPGEPCKMHGNLYELKVLLRLQKKYLQAQSSMEFSKRLSLGEILGNRIEELEEE